MRIPAPVHPSVTGGRVSGPVVLLLCLQENSLDTFQKTSVVKFEMGQKASRCIPFFFLVLHIKDDLDLKILKSFYGIDGR